MPAQFSNVALCQIDSADGLNTIQPHTVKFLPKTTGQCFLMNLSSRFLRTDL